MGNEPHHKGNHPAAHHFDGDDDTSARWEDNFVVFVRHGVRRRASDCVGERLLPAAEIPDAQREQHNYQGHAPAQLFTQSHTVLKAEITRAKAEKLTW
jgi:hypothetical protein